MARILSDGAQPVHAAGTLRVLRDDSGIIDTLFPIIGGKVEDVNTKVERYKDKAMAVINDLINGGTGVSVIVSVVCSSSYSDTSLDCYAYVTSPSW